MTAGLNNRELGRINAVNAGFVFEGRTYDVVDISSNGLLIECKSGFKEETVRKFRSGNFEFRLVDPVSGSEIDFIGDLVRSERAVQDDRVERIGLSFRQKRESGQRVWQAGGGAKAGEQAAAAGTGKKTIAMGGGKGGVGKTIISVNLALALSQMNKRVTLFDGDFGNANCNTLLGMTRVESSVEDYLCKDLSLEEVMLSTSYPQLSLICGAQNKADDLISGKRQRLLNDISMIDCDCLVIDLGAGVSDDALDLYKLANEKIIILTPQFTALQNAYGFIKSAFYHDLKENNGSAAFLEEAGSDPVRLKSLVGSLDSDNSTRAEFTRVAERQSFKIVGNMVDSEKDLKIIENLQQVVKDYLNIESMVLGTFESSKAIQSSVNRLTPFVALDPEAKNSREIKWIATKISRS